MSRERTAEFQGVFSPGPRKHVGVGEGVVRELRGTLNAKADDRVREIQLGWTGGILRFYVDAQCGGGRLLRGRHGLHRVAALAGHAKFVQNVRREGMDVGEVKK